MKNFKRLLLTIFAAIGLLIVVAINFVAYSSKEFRQEFGSRFLIDNYAAGIILDPVELQGEQIELIISTVPKHYDDSFTVWPFDTHVGPLKVVSRGNGPGHIVVYFILYPCNAGEGICLETGQVEAATGKITDQIEIREIGQDGQSIVLPQNAVYEAPQLREFTSPKNCKMKQSQVDNETPVMVIVLLCDQP